MKKLGNIDEYKIIKKKDIINITRDNNSPEVFAADDIDIA